MALPTFDQLLAQTNPNGVGLNVTGYTDGNTGVTDGSGGNVSFDNNTAGTGAANTGGAAAAAVDPNAIAQYDQSIGNVQRGIDRTGAQLNSGYGKIDANFQDIINQLLTGENQAKNTYTDNKHQTGVDYVGAKNTVGANAGNSLNGLLRILGSRGAGGSSTALISAPGAVARQATLQRADAANTYGSNNKSLDTNWNNYEVGVNNQRSSAARQKDQARQDLENSINSGKATLLQQLAALQGQRASAAGGNAVGSSQAAYDQANSLLDETANYSTAPINWQTQAYTAPTLDKYLVAPNAAPTVQGQSQPNDYTSPYLAALLGKKQPTTAGA